MDFSMNGRSLQVSYFFVLSSFIKTEKIADNVRIMVRGFLYVIPLVVP
jgi:hypothetical protein